MTTPTNKTRATRAFNTLSYYKEHENDDTKTSVIDLMTDILHLLDKHEIDHRAVVETAMGHYEAEVEEAVGCRNPLPAKDLGRDA